MLTYASVMRLFENFDGQFYDILVEQDRSFPSTPDVGTVSDFLDKYSPLLGSVQWSEIPK